MKQVDQAETGYRRSCQFAPISAHTKDHQPDAKKPKIDPSVVVQAVVHRSLPTLQQERADIRPAVQRTLESQRLGSIAFSACGIKEIVTLREVSKSLSVLSTYVVKSQLASSKSVDLKQLKKYQSFLNTSLSEVLDLMFQLEQLNLEMVQPEEFRDIFQSKRCDKWKTIFINKFNASEEDLLMLAEKCTSLETFAQSFCTGMTDRVLSTIASQCRNLLNMSISYPDAVIGEEGVDVLFDLCNRLDNLSLMNLANAHSDAPLEIQKSGQKLKIFKLSNYPLRVDTLVGIANRCPLLSTLHLTNTPIRDGQFSSVASHLPNLRSLMLSNMAFLEKGDLHSFIRQSAKLEFIALCDLDINDDTLVAISSCSRLSTLRLIGSAHLTEAAVLRLVQTCPLKKIEISRCPRISASLIAQAKKINPDIVIELSKKEHRTI